MIPAANPLLKSTPSVWTLDEDCINVDMLVGEQCCVLRPIFLIPLAHWTIKEVYR